MSIDETLEFDLYYYDGGVPGSDVLSKQLEAFNTTSLPYRCGDEERGAAGCAVLRARVGMTKAGMEIFGGANGGGCTG